MPDLDPHKGGYRERLRKRWDYEGRLQEVEEFRERVRLDSQKAGATKRAAREHAWEETIRNFPPLSDEELAARQAEPGEEEEEVVRLLSKQAGKPHDGGLGRLVKSRIPVSWGDLPAQAAYGVEVDWAYQNFYEAREVRENGSRLKLSKCASPAPSRGAVGLLEWAVENRTAFFKEVVPRSKAKSGVDTESSVRERKSIEEIRGLLAEADKKHPSVVIRELVEAFRGGGDVESAVLKAEQYLERI